MRVVKNGLDAKNANLILNPTSGAPGFNLENVFCFPGVPSILKINVRWFKKSNCWRQNQF